MVKIDNQSFTKKRKAITDLIAGDINLRSKKELSSSESSFSILKLYI